MKSPLQHAHDEIRYLQQARTGDAGRTARLTQQLAMGTAASAKQAGCVHSGGIFCFHCGG